jgi:hypothetical protein
MPLETNLQRRSCMLDTGLRPTMDATGATGSGAGPLAGEAGASSAAFALPFFAGTALGRLSTSARLRKKIVESISLKCTPSGNMSSAKRLEDDKTLF